MRRSVITNVLFMSAVGLAAGGLLAACEDGPNQPYSPAKGTAFNNGDTPAAVDDAGTSLTSNYGGTSKTEICSGQELQQQWGAMVHQPIKPPYVFAGVDTSGGPTFPGLTLEEAENGGGPGPVTVPNAPPPPTRLCQPGGALGQGGNSSDVIGGTNDVYFGNNQELLVEYAVSNHKFFFEQLSPGYVGTMSWSYQVPSSGCVMGEDPSACDGKMHNYVYQINEPILKDGKTFYLDWTDTTLLYPEIDEIYRGLASTFNPDIYDNAPQGVYCTSTGTCLQAIGGNNDGTGRALFGYRPISMYLYTAPPAQGRLSGSTMVGAYFFNIKYAPYSPAHTTVKMNDQQGPFASLNPIGDMAKSCLLQMGNTYGDLQTNCINVYKSSATDTLAQAKILGNLTHDDQNFSFSIVGDNQNYSPPELNIGGSRQFDIIHDGELPAATAVASNFQFDVRAFGGVTNDGFTTVTNGVTLLHKDYHGSGAIEREWGRSIQTQLAAAYHAANPSVPLRSVHDPACYYPMECEGGAACTGQTYSNCGAGCKWTTPLTSAQINVWRPAPGCTGFESYVTNAYPNMWGHNTSNPALDGQPVNPANPATVNPDNTFDQAGGLGGGAAPFKPGGQYVNFCSDPGQDNFCLGADYNFGVGSQNAVDLLGGAYALVVQYLGQGDILNVPEEGRDYRYYFQQYVIAYAKYLASPAASDSGQNGTPPAPTRYFGNYPLDLDNIFFDSIGGNAAKGEFVDFDFADATHDPMGFEMQMLLLGTNLQSVNFYRRLDREERAIFMALENQDAKTAGQPSWALNRTAGGAVVNDIYGFPKKNASVLLSNIAGSPAIAAGSWTEVDDMNGVPVVVDATKQDPCDPTKPLSYTAQYCATHVDANCPVQAPTDDSGAIIKRPNGKPLLADYCGIWNPTAFAIGQSPIQLEQTIPLEEEAKVMIPTYDNPYGMTGTMKPLEVLVPWKPQQEGIGFPVAAGTTGGQQDVFVETAQLDFTGQVITPVMDFLPVQNQVDGGASVTNVNILAYETQDFLGDVFLCVDPGTAADRAGTNRPGDVLNAHMYTSAAVVLDWISNHPQAVSACGLVVRYSPYGNYPDYVTSLTYGVRLGIDQGAGYGRVVDATIFQPGSGAVAPP